MIGDQPGYYEVTVSISAPYNDPGFRPFDGCVVRVEDGEGNVRSYDNRGQGIYRAYLEPPFLGVGKVYSLSVNTPGNANYRSDYDTLLACPPVDSLYYLKQTSGGTDPDDVWQGIQFYNDVKGNPNGKGNYRWKAVATWEYRSPYTAQYIRYRGINYANTVDSVGTCYLTESIETIYAASTRLLTENSIYQNKLHYVSDQTPRLAQRYSLLLEQHSLTDQAYSYWEKIAAQSGSGANLYETQPSSSQGNIYRVDSDEKVLGCFYATQIQEKRIFVDKDDLDFFAPSYTCRLDTLLNNNTFLFDKVYYLISLAELGAGPPWLGGMDKCFNCTKRGGENEKPDFWEDE
jgi:hypothetical protein